MAYLIHATLLMDDAAAADTAVAAASSSNLVMVIFKAFIAVYLIVGAIRGKGRLIDNEYPKCKPETYRLVMRILCAVTGIIILINSGVEFLANSAYGARLPLTVEEYAKLGTVLWAVGLAALLALVVANILLTDRKAAEAARKKQELERTHATPGDPLRAAFVFDEEEVSAGTFQRREDGDKDGEPRS